MRRTILALAISCATLSAHAEERDTLARRMEMADAFLHKNDAPREIDFAQKLLDLQGQPFVECLRASDDGRSCAEHADATLGLIVSAALSRPADPRAPEDIKRLLTRGNLAIRISGEKQVALTAEEIALIKEQLTKLSIHTVELARAVKLLDPAEK